MGADQSTCLMAWDPESERVEQIRTLSQSADVFLEGHPAFTGNFQLEAHLDSMQCAVNADSRLQQWVPKLVPKRISEELFWANYFSHIMATGGLPPILFPTGPADSTSTSTSTSTSMTEPTTGSTTPKVPASPAHNLYTPQPRRSRAPSLALGGQQGSALLLLAGFPARPEFQKPFGPYVVSIPVEGAALSPSSPIMGGPSKTLNWGIIGSGDPLELETALAIQRIPGFRIVAVMRPSPADAKQYAAQLNVNKYFTQARALIDVKDVDVVYIATPPGSHRDLVLACLAAGKVCYMDPSMGRNASECREMLQAAEAAPGPFEGSSMLWVAYTMRCLERFRVARQLLEQGQVGQVTAVSYRYARGSMLAGEDAARFGWKLDPAHAGGGLLMDIGAHTLDILDYLLGPLAHVHGDAVASAPAAEVEACVAMTFRTPSGAVCSASWNFVSAVDEDVMVIDGTLGRLSMSLFDKDPPVLQREGNYIYYPTSYPSTPQVPLLSAIADKLLRPSQCSHTGLPNGDVAYRTGRVLDGVLRSFYRDRSDEFWRRPWTWRNQPEFTVRDKRAQIPATQLAVPASAGPPPPAYSYNAAT